MKENLDSNLLLTGLAIALTLAAFLPYIRSILQNKVRPHVFSWVIWGVTTSLVFVAQLRGGGGAGAWAIGASGAVTLFIACLAYWKRADLDITKTDCLFLMAALSSLPVWYFTSNPLWAVIILTGVDLLGFGPTVRKAYFEPQSESLVFFGLFAVRNAVVIVALEHHSLTTVLFPAAIGAACLGLIGLLIVRRRVV